MYMYMYMYMYIYICICIYKYIPAASTCAKFWHLSKEYTISALAVFLSKKSVLGRSSLSHIEVVLFQVVIPMLQLLDTVGACY